LFINLITDSNNFNSIWLW